MLCPDDGSDLVDDATGVSSCRRCRGHAISGEAFSRIHADVAALLRRDEDRDGGGWARLRLCPACRGPMRPLRIDDQLAWLESCDAGAVLWVERLDDAVVERRERRHALARGVESFTPAERREMARDMAGEMAEENRRIRLIEWIRQMLHDLAGR